MQEGDNPRCVALNNIDLWVQIHDLQLGFMSERIITEVGNHIGTFLSSCPNNFRGIWREYMRVRVAINIEKPLKRRMKVCKAGNEWIWITYKYENLPIFFFICGIMGHLEKFCNRLFDTPESEIVKFHFEDK